MYIPPEQYVYTVPAPYFPAFHLMCPGKDFSVIQQRLLGSILIITVVNHRGKHFWPFGPGLHVCFFIASFLFIFLLFLNLCYCFFLRNINNVEVT